MNVLAHSCGLWFKCQPSLQSLCNAFAVLFCQPHLYVTQMQDCTPHSGEEKATSQLLHGGAESQGFPPNLVEDECCTAWNCGMGTEDKGFNMILAVSLMQPSDEEGLCPQTWAERLLPLLQKWVGMNTRVPPTGSTKEGYHFLPARQ